MGNWKRGFWIWELGKKFSDVKWELKESDYLKEKGIGIWEVRITLLCSFFQEVDILEMEAVEVQVVEEEVAETQLRVARKTKRNIKKTKRNIKQNKNKYKKTKTNIKNKNKYKKKQKIW